MKFDLVELLKLPGSIMSAIAVATGLILFLPNSIISMMYMDDFRNKYGFLIGTVFIISLSILIVGAIIKVYNFSHEKYINKKVKKNSRKLLESLDSYKKTIVYMLYCEDNNTHVLPLNDGAIVFLEHWMVIQKATNQYAVSDLINPEFPYFLQAWVVNELNRDCELLISFRKEAELNIGKMEYNNSCNENYW